MPQDHDVKCPTCGTFNPQDATICKNRSCQALLTSRKWSKEGRIAPDAQRARESEKPPQQDQTPTDDTQSAGNGTAENQISGDEGSRPPGQRRFRLWWIYVAAGVLLAGPATYAAGYLTNEGRMLHKYAPMALDSTSVSSSTATTPPPSSSTAPPSSSSTRSHARMAPSASPSNDTTSSTPPSTSQAPAPAASPSLKPSAQSAKDPVPPRALNHFRGSAYHGHLVGTLWVSAGNGPRVAVTVWVDTGSQSTYINKSLAKRLGLRPTGMGSGVTGYGGATLTQAFPPLDLWLHRTGPRALAYRVSLQDGISGLGKQAPAILLGENFLKQGALLQNHTAWSFTFYGPLAPHGPAVTSKELPPMSFPGGPKDSIRVSGRLRNNVLVARALVSRAQGGQPYPGLMQVDTGAYTTIVNGGVLRQALRLRPGNTAYYMGVGGVQTAHMYNRLWLRTATGQPYILQNATMVSGLSTQIGSVPILLSIGQDDLTRSVFWQVGNTWGADLEPLEGTQDLPQNTAPWWYGKYAAGRFGSNH